MTDFQFQLLIGTILGSMLLIILAVVIAARVIILHLESQRATLMECGVYSTIKLTEEIRGNKSKRGNSSYVSEYGAQVREYDEQKFQEFKQELERK